MCIYMQKISNKHILNYINSYNHKNPTFRYPTCEFGSRVNENQTFSYFSFHVKPINHKHIHTFRSHNLEKKNKKNI